MVLNMCNSVHVWLNVLVSWMALAVRCYALFASASCGVVPSFSVGKYLTEMYTSDYDNFPDKGAAKTDVSIGEIYESRN